MDPLQLAAEHFFNGLRALGSDDLETAEACFLTALELVPDRPSTLVNLSVVRTRQNRLPEALSFAERATQSTAAEPLHWLQKGVVLMKLARYDEALACFDLTLDGNPALAEAHAHRARVLSELNRSADALASCDRAITLKPDYAEAHNNRGSVLRDLGRPEEALASYDTAIGLRPDFAEAHYNRGRALHDLGRFDEAVASYDTAVSLRPDRAEAHGNRGVALRELNRLAEALASYDTAIALKADYAEAHYNRGNVLRELDRPDEASESFATAISLKPGYADAHFNRGIALKEAGRFDEALASYDTAIGLQPGDMDFRANRSHLLLLLGRFGEGLPDYEARKTKKTEASRTLDATQPSWLGQSDLAGKTLLVHWEQGFGDTIQFSRYAGLLSGRGARVLFSPQRQLRRLMSSLRPAVEIVDDADPALRFDFQMPLLSAMLAEGTDLRSIPGNVPYLAPEPERVRFWRGTFGVDRPRLTVGICWQGSTGKIDQGRSFPLGELQAISVIPGVRLVSLHKGEGESQLAGLPADMRVDTLGMEFDSGPDAFIDTAAVISLCDLVITSDTAVAHLAGALGAPTWLALKHVPDWRWLLNRNDSPWYPTMRLFRQKTAGDWDGVFAEMEAELRKMADARGRP